MHYVIWNIPSKGNAVGRMGAVLGADSERFSMLKYDRYAHCSKVPSVKYHSKQGTFQWPNLHLKHHSLGGRKCRSPQFSKGKNWHHIERSFVIAIYRCHMQIAVHYERRELGSRFCISAFETWQWALKLQFAGELPINLGLHGIRVHIDNFDSMRNRILWTLWLNEHYDSWDSKPIEGVLRVSANSM